MHVLTNGAGGNTQKTIAQTLSKHMKVKKTTLRFWMRSWRQFKV